MSYFLRSNPQSFKNEPYTTGETSFLFLSCLPGNLENPREYFYPHFYLSNVEMYMGKNMKGMGGIYFFGYGGNMYDKGKAEEGEKKISC